MYVPPTAESRRRVHDLRAAKHPGERQATGDRLRDGNEIGLDVIVLDREQAPGARKAGLDLVCDEHDAVLVADLPHAAHELAGRDDESAFALHGLDDDRRHLLGRHLGNERVLERSEGRRCVRSAVVVRERNPIDLGRERAETRLVRVGLRGERQGEQRAAMEAALECDHGRALRVRARKLHRVLDSLRA